MAFLKQKKILDELAAQNDKLNSTKTRTAEPVEPYVTPTTSTIIASVKKEPAEQEKKDERKQRLYLLGGRHGLLLSQETVSTARLNLSHRHNEHREGW